MVRETAPSTERLASLFGSLAAGGKLDQEGGIERKLFEETVHKFFNNNLNWYEPANAIEKAKKRGVMYEKGNKIYMTDFP